MIKPAIHRHNPGTHGAGDAPAAVDRAGLEQVYALAVGRHQQGDLDEAARLYQVILGVDPGHAGSLHLLGVMANQLGDDQTACELIERAIGHNPRVAAFHYNIATIHQANGRIERAVSAYRKAVRLDPGYREAYENLGVVQQERGDYAAARQAYAKALELNPGSVTALLNMATLLHETGRPAQALEYFDRVLALQPDYPEARSKRAQLLLAMGRFTDGWEDYPWLFRTASFLAGNPDIAIPYPAWDGTPLQDQRLLIVADQGIGDEVMFASCLPDTLARAPCTTLECSPRLVALFERSFPGLAVLPLGGSERPRAAYDYSLRLSELPRLFRRAAQDFPVPRPYLRVDATQADHWRRRLQTLGGRLNVGLSWQGGNNPRVRNARSVPLDLWRTVVETPGVNVINLQYGDHAAEIDSFNQGRRQMLHRLEGIDPLIDLDGFGALLSALDLVISVDNSTVHFAGAIGTPVWVLLSSFPEWRWMYGRSDSLWYPRMTLFRSNGVGLQAKRRVVAKLAARLATYRAVHGVGDQD